MREDCDGMSHSLIFPFDDPDSERPPCICPRFPHGQSHSYSVLHYLLNDDHWRADSSAISVPGSRQDNISS
jgi:hypothetical protein